MNYPYPQRPHHLHTRQLVRSIPCPRCGAGPGQKCLNIRTLLQSASHPDRYRAWKNTQPKE